MRISALGCLVAAVAAVSAIVGTAGATELDLSGESALPAAALAAIRAQGPGALLPFAAGGLASATDGGGSAGAAVTTDDRTITVTAQASASGRIEGSTVELANLSGAGSATQAITTGGFGAIDQASMGAVSIVQATTGFNNLQQAPTVLVFVP